MEKDLMQGPCEQRSVSIPATMNEILTSTARRNFRTVSKEIQLALVRHLGSSGGNGKQEAMENEEST